MLPLISDPGGHKGMLSRRAKIVSQWILVVLFLFGLIYIGDVSELTRWPKIHWSFVLLAFLSTVGFTLIHNLRWMAIVKRMSKGSAGLRRDFFQFYRWLLNSYALGTVIPSDISLAGVRTYYVNRSRNLLLPAALFSVLLDRFFDFIVFFVLAFPSFLMITKVGGEIKALSILGLFMAAVFLFIYWKKGEGLDSLMQVYRSGMELLLKLPIIGKRIEGKWKEETLGKSSFSEGSVYQMMGWSFLKYLLLSLRFYFTGRALGVTFPFLQGVFFIPFIQLVGMLNITPGGLGVVEMGSYGALMLMGVSESKAMVFVVGQRILLSCITISLALASHFIFFMRSRRVGERGKG